MVDSLVYIAFIVMLLSNSNSNNWLLWASNAVKKSDVLFCFRFVCREGKKIDHKAMAVGTAASLDHAKKKMQRLTKQDGTTLKYVNDGIDILKYWCFFSFKDTSNSLLYKAIWKEKKEINLFLSSASLSPRLV